MYNVCGAFSNQGLVALSISAFERVQFPLELEPRLSGSAFWGHGGCPPGFLSSFADPCHQTVILLWGISLFITTHPGLTLLLLGPPSACPLRLARDSAGLHPQVPPHLPAHPSFLRSCPRYIWPFTFLF